MNGNTRLIVLVGLQAFSNSKNYAVRLREPVFLWIMDEYDKRKNEYKIKHNVRNFDQFADIFLRGLLEELNSAKQILTI